jgi:hypothetical protein
VHDRYYNRKKVLVVCWAQQVFFSSEFAPLHPHLSVDQKSNDEKITRFDSLFFHKIDMGELQFEKLRAYYAATTAPNRHHSAAAAAAAKLLPPPTHCCHPPPLPPPPPKTVGGQIYNTIQRRNLMSTYFLVDNIFAGVKVLK